MTPFFLKPSQDELGQYYADMAASTSLPVMAYNNPGRTGVDLPPATIARIAGRVPNFKGIKDSSGDLTQLAEYIRLCPPDFQAFVGRDSLIFGALIYGAAGAVAAAARAAAGRPGPARPPPHRLAHPADTTARHAPGDGRPGNAARAHSVRRGGC